MSADEYVPSDEDVREGYALAPFEDELPDYGDEFLGQTADDRRAAWSRWLASHDARVRRDAARERFEDFIANVQTMHDGTHLHAGRIVYAEVIRLAEVYVKHHLPETED